MCYNINMTNRTTLNISLTPELSQYIESKLKSGMYTSGSEIIREALRLFKSYEEIKANTLADLKDKIEAGILQAKSGKILDGENFLSDLEKNLEC